MYAVKYLDAEGNIQESAKQNTKAEAKSIGVELKAAQLAKRYRVVKRARSKKAKK